MTTESWVTSTSSLTVDEGSSTTYTVRLATQPTATVTVSVSWLQGDADLSATPAALSFTTGDWNTTQTVTVRAAEDNDLANGRATFWHSASGGGYGGVTATVTATEQDDDTAQLRFSTTSITVPEDDDATYTVPAALCAHGNRFGFRRCRKRRRRRHYRTPPNPYFYDL